MMSVLRSRFRVEREEGGLKPAYKDEELVAQAFFEPNDTILYFERHEASNSRCEKESGGDKDLEDRIRREAIVADAEERPNQVGHENRQQEEVKGREKLGVI